MATFLLIPGAGGDPTFWYRVAPLLVAAGHRVVAVDRLLGFLEQI